jgi:hypothetical protein
LSQAASPKSNAAAATDVTNFLPCVMSIAQYLLIADEPEG